MRNPGLSPALRHPLARLLALALAAAPAPSSAAAPAAAAPPEVRSVTSLPVAGAASARASRFARPLVNGWVTPDDTFPVFSHGFDDLAGSCDPRGWTGEDRTPLVFAHVSDRFVVNQDFFTGRSSNSFPPVFAYPIAVDQALLDHPGALAVNDSGCVSFAQDRPSTAPPDVFQLCPGDGFVRYRGPAPGGTWFTSMVFDPLTRNIYGASGFNQIYAYAPGSGSLALVTGGPTGSFADTLASVARLGIIGQLAVDGDGNLYWAETGAHKVRMLRRNDQRVVTIAGTGVSGFGGDGGDATLAQLASPGGLAIDPAARKLYVMDTYNQRVRVVDLATGIIGSLPSPAGGFEFNGPEQAAWSAGSLYASDWHHVLRFSAGSWSVAAGGGDWFGPASDAAMGRAQRLDKPTGLTGDGVGGVYFTARHMVLRLGADGTLAALAGIPASVRMGQRALWFGADSASAPAETRQWVQNQGFGNGWSQRLTSPPVDLATHPNTTVTFDTYLEITALGDSLEPVALAFGKMFTVQAQRADGGWSDLLPTFLGRNTGRQVSVGGGTVAGAGTFKVVAQLNAGFNAILGLGATSRFRIVLQTDASGSNEDGSPPATRGAGAAVVDNITVQDGVTNLMPVADFEDGTTNGWALSALNGPVRLNTQIFRDLAPVGTQVALRSGYDFADPTCVWTFDSPGDTLAKGTLARLTSPWFARVPGQPDFSIALSGKLNTLEQSRFVTFALRGKRAGDTHTRAYATSFFALSAGPGPADINSPYFTDRLIQYPVDFAGPVDGDSLQLVVQVEDWGELIGGSLDNRPTTRLPYLDNVWVFQRGVDQDFDGVADAFDACPAECAAGQDADGDGCIDPHATLRHVESWAQTDLPIRFRLSQDGDPSIKDGSDLTALRAAFQAWQAVDGDSLPIVEEPLTAQKEASATDGVNLVTFQDSEPFDPDVIAVTPTLSFTKRTAFGDRIVLPGQIVDADMIFNPNASYLTPSHAGSFDLRSVATHEAGHFLGLSHTGVQDATMFFVLQEADGAASLEPDDEAAVASAYPAAKMTTLYGAIRGVVRRGADLSPIPGALVTAVTLDPAGAPKGSPVASDYSAEDGSYALRRLAAGRYGVYVSPLDGRDGGLTPNYISERVNKIAQTNFDAEWWSTPESDRDDPTVITAIDLGTGERRDSINVTANVDTLPPLVESVSPPADSTRIRIDATIVARFTEPIADSTLRGAFHVYAGPDTVQGNAALAAGLKTLIFTPVVPLRFGTTYTLAISSQVTDRQGVHLPADFHSSFTTQEQPSLALFDIQPRSAPVGAIVTLTGAGFEQIREPQVAFTVLPGGPGLTDPALQTPTQLVVRVPLTATSGDVEVRQINSQPSNPIRFTVLPPTPQFPPQPLGGDLAANLAPTGVAVAPGGNMVYAVGSGGISTIGLDPADPANFQVARTRAIGNAKHIALMPDGRRGYVTFPDPGWVVEVVTEPGNGLLRTPIDTIPVFGSPDGISISPSGRRTYVTDPLAGVIHEIDTDPNSSSRNTVLRDLPTSGDALGAGVAVDPLGTRIYYSTTNAGSAALDLASEARASAHTGNSADGAAVTPDQSLVIFPDPGSGTLLWSQITPTGFVPHQLALGGAPRDVAVNREGRSAFVVNSALNLLESIDVTDPLNLRKVSEIGTGTTPVAVAMSRDSNVIAVANFGSRTVSIYTAAGGNGIALRRIYQQVTMPGDVVAAMTDSTGPGTFADLGQGTFPVSNAERYNGVGGVAFTTPPSAQRPAFLSLQQGTARSLSLPLPILDHIQHPVPRTTALAGLLVGGVPVCHPGEVFDLAEAPDGGLIATSWTSSTIGCDETVLSFTGADGVGVNRFGEFQRTSLIAAGGAGMGRHLAFTADSRNLWVTRDLDVFIFDASRSSPTYGQVVASAGDISTEPPTALATDPLGRFMFLGTGHGDVAFYRYDPAPVKVTMVPVGAGLPTQVGSMIASPDGRWLIVGFEGNVQFIDIGAPSAVITPGPPHAGAPIMVSLAVTGDGRRVMGLAANGLVGVWNLDPAAGPIGQELFFGSAGPPGVTKLVPSPDGHGVQGVRPSGATLVHYELNAIPPVAYETPVPPVTTIAASGDGRRIWTAPPVPPDGIAQLGVLSLSEASLLSIVSGDGQTGAPFGLLPQPVRVHVASASGHPESGVVVEFTLPLDGSAGNLDPDVFEGAKMVRRITDARGEAEVKWQLPSAGGAFALGILAHGVPGGALTAHASFAIDDALVDPVLVELAPPDGSADLNAGTAVLARFNQKMDVESMKSHLSLDAGGNPVGGNLSLADEGRTVIFQPAGALPFSAACRLLVTAGATDQEGNVLTAGGAASFTVQARPPLAVSAIDPPAASAGSAVTLIGSGFNPATTLNTVTFNGIVAGVVSASSGLLSVIVPHDATTGNVIVQANSATSSPVEFTVLAANPDPGGIIGTLPSGGGVRDMAITPDGRRVYVTNPGTNSVSALDIQAAAGLAAIPVGLRPQGIDILPTGARAYVTNTGSDDVSVIDTDPASPHYHEVANTIPVGTSPVGIVARGQQVYVLNTGSGTLDVIDANPGNATYDHITATANVGSKGGGGVDVTADGGRAYASTSAGITVIDLTKSPPVAADTVAIPTGVTSIAIRPNQASAIALALDGRIYVIDILPGSPNANRIIASGNTGSRGAGTVDVSGDGTLAYVSSPDGNLVFVFQIVDGTSGAAVSRPGSLVPGPAVSLVPLPSIEIANAPLGLATDPLGRFTLVASSGTGAITVIGSSTSLSPVSVEFDFDPNRLNLDSHGRYVTGYIEPAPPRSADDIDLASIRLNGIVPIADPPHHHPGDDSGVLNVDDPVNGIGDHDHDGIPDLKVQFSRSAVELILPVGDKVPVVVTGLIGPRRFEGTDSVKVKRARMLAPLANAVVPPKARFDVRWETPHDSRPRWVAVIHSFDGGVSWTTDATHQPDTGHYAWMVPDTTLDSARVAVVLVEDEDHSTGDIEGVLAASEPFFINATSSVGSPPLELSFSRVQPNPAIGRARMRFGLPARAAVELDVFDVQGRHVRTLARGTREPGWSGIEWRGETDGGGRAGAGIYFARFRAQGREFRQRFTLLR